MHKLSSNMGYTKMRRTKYPDLRAHSYHIPAEGATHLLAAVTA